MEFLASCDFSMASETDISQFEEFASVLSDDEVFLDTGEDGAEVIYDIKFYYFMKTREMMFSFVFRHFF